MADAQEVRSGLHEGAVRPVRETGKPVAQAARDPSIDEGPDGMGECGPARRGIHGYDPVSAMSRWLRPGRGLSSRLT
jgi:hypothetical protein